MKNPILIFVLYIVSFTTYAQQLEDIIYPQRGKTLANISIDKISDGNMVHFIYKGNDTIVEAKAVQYNGVYTEFKEIILHKKYNRKYSPLNYDSVSDLEFENHSYVYHHINYLRAKKGVRRGIAFSSIGAVALGSGIGLYLYEYSHPEEYDFELEAGSALLLSAGLTFSIMGLINMSIYTSKKQKSKQKLKNCTYKSSLNLKTGKDGVGLVFRF